MGRQAELQKRFYADFPAHEQEKVYAFATPSTMKPTQIKCAEGGVNQLPPWTEFQVSTAACRGPPRWAAFSHRCPAVFQGDIRLTPFYNAAECQKKVEEYVADINAKLHYLPTRGPCSKYAIKKADGEDFKGSIELEWNGEPFKGAPALFAACWMSLSMRMSPIGLPLVGRDCVQAGLPRLCRAEAGDEGGQGQCRALLDLWIPPACRRHAGGRIRRAGARKAAPSLLRVVSGPV